MTALKERDPTSLKGSDREEDPAEEPHYRTPEGRHVEALLDISEEILVEPEPHEHHCASGWEEAVRGWARVAPLSCIFSSQKPHRKTKHKDVGSPSLPNAERSACVESRTGSTNGVRKSAPLHRQTGCWNTPQAGASGWTAQRAPSTEEGSAPSLPSKQSVPEHGPAKPPKHSSKPVPIKNFAFLPPIRSPQRQPTLCDHLCSSVKASDQEASREHGFLIDKRSEAGTRWGPAANAESPVYSAALLSTCPTCRHNLSLFSAVRYRVPASSKRDAGHCSSFSMGKSLTPALHSAAAVGAHAPGYLFS